MSGFHFQGGASNSSVPTKQFCTKQEEKAAQVSFTNLGLDRCWV